MRTSRLKKPIVLLTIALLSSVFFFAFFFLNKSDVSSTSASRNRDSMARTFILWLHGLGDSGPANEPIKTLFRSQEFRNTKWLFPSAPPNPVSCNCMIALYFLILVLFVSFFSRRWLWSSFLNWLSWTNLHSPK